MEIVNENNEINNNNKNENSERFHKDLEFIQNLSNAAYLHCKLLFSFSYFSLSLIFF